MMLSPRSTLGAGLCTAFVLSASGCQHAAQPKAKQAIPVATATARRSAVPYTIIANGIVTPEQTANVTSLVDGVITDVPLREGQDVVKGQKMFQIDVRPYMAAYNQSRATLMKDLATLIDDEREDQRYADLVKQDYVTKEQADQEHFTYEAQKATVAADSANIANAKYNLDNSTVVAPITGRTGILYVRIGNTVHGSSATTLTTVNQIHPIEVEFPVPATSLPDIQKYGSNKKLPVTVYQTAVEPQTAAPSAISMPADPRGDTAAGASIIPPGTSNGRSRSGQFSSGTRGNGTADGNQGGQGAQAGGGGGGGEDANGVQTGPIGGPPGGTMTGVQAGGGPVGPGVSGTLAFINNAVDTTTGTVLLKAEFDNKDNALWPGEFVATTLQLYVQQDALVIPEQATMTGQQGTYVYVVDATGTAHQRQITIARTYQGQAVIASGLKEGEEVVSDGQSRLTPNAKVFVRTAANTPSSGGAGGMGTDSAGQHHGHGGKSRS